MVRTHRKIQDFMVRLPPIMLSNSHLLLGLILVIPQIQRISIYSSIQASRLHLYSNRLSSPNNKHRWVEVGHLFKAIRNRQVSKAFWISNRCNQTWCIRFSKLQEETIIVWACTTEDRSSLVQATTLLLTCTLTPGLCWSLERISILKTYIARWYSRCKESNNYYEKSRENQMPMIG
jgi:hypothetical protein